MMRSTTFRSCWARRTRTSQGQPWTHVGLGLSSDSPPLSKISLTQPGPARTPCGPWFIPRLAPAVRDQLDSAFHALRVPALRLRAERLRGFASLRAPYFRSLLDAGRKERMIVGKK